jgi:hypothetical protein
VPDFVLGPGDQLRNKTDMTAELLKVTVELRKWVTHKGQSNRVSPHMAIMP